MSANFLFYLFMQLQSRFRLHNDTNNQCASCARWNLESTPACDVLAAHVHLILSTQSRYLNTYYVSICAQVNYRIEELFVLLSYANQITVEWMTTHVQFNFITKPLN